MVKIGLYQSGGEYPSLHVMVTDNERYYSDRKLYDDAESAAAAIKKWLDVALTNAVPKS